MALRRHRTGVRPKHPPLTVSMHERASVMKDEEDRPALLATVAAPIYALMLEKFDFEEVEPDDFEEQCIRLARRAVWHASNVVEAAYKYRSERRRGNSQIQRPQANETGRD